MMPSMHSIYTEIDARSYDAIVKNGYLSEVLLALLVDPLEAEDVADSVTTRDMGKISISVNGLVSSAPISPADFQALPSKDGFEKMKITLSQWAAVAADARESLLPMATWDVRFGIWCACQVARSALVYVPSGEERPLFAIEAAERWLQGKFYGTPIHSIRSQLRSAADGAFASSVETVYSASQSAYAACAAALEASFYQNRRAAALCSSAASQAASAFADSLRLVTGSDRWRRASESESIRLRKVIAEACLTFPG